MGFHAWALMNQTSSFTWGWDEAFRQLRMISLIIAKGLERNDLYSEQIAVAESNSVRCLAGLTILRGDAQPSAQVTSGCALQTIRNAVELADVFLFHDGVER